MMPLNDAFVQAVSLGIDDAWEDEVATQTRKSARSNGLELETAIEYMVDENANRVMARAIREHGMPAVLRHLRKYIVLK